MTARRAERSETCTCQRCAGPGAAAAANCTDQLAGRVRDAAARYRVGLCTASDLLIALADARVAAGGSVPTAVQDGVIGAEALIAKARRTVSVPDRPVVIGRILDKLEATLDDACAQGGER